MEGKSQLNYIGETLFLIDLQLENLHVLSVIIIS